MRFQQRLFSAWRIPRPGQLVFKRQMFNRIVRISVSGSAFNSGSIFFGLVIPESLLNCGYVMALLEINLILLS